MSYLPSEALIQQLTEKEQFSQEILRSNFDPLLCPSSQGLGESQGSPEAWIWLCRPRLIPHKGGLPCAQRKPVIWLVYFLQEK